MEIAYHQPFMMIIHELLSTEDTDYLVDWATPRLSRTRQINLAEDDGKRPKNEWRTRKTVSGPASTLIAQDPSSYCALIGCTRAHFNI